MTICPWAVIPTAQLEAAAGFGKLVTQGVLRWEECIGSLLKAAQAGGYRGDAGGARTFLAWRVRESATEWEITRGKADRAIRKAVTVLVQEHQPGRMILAAGSAENTRWGEPFGSEEIEAIACEEAAWWVRQSARVLEYA